MKVDEARELKDKALSKLSDVDISEFIEAIAKAAARGDDFVKYDRISPRQRLKLEHYGYQIRDEFIGGW